MRRNGGPRARLRRSAACGAQGTPFTVYMPTEAWNLAAVKRQIYGITGVPCTKQVLHYADAQLCDAYDGDSEPPSIPAGAELRAVAVHHVGRSFQVFVKTLTVRKRARVRVQCGGLTVSCCGRGQQKR